MTCKTCGHDESFHNRILNSDLCPFDYIDGECIADGKRIVTRNQVKWFKLKSYTIDRIARGYGYGTRLRQNKSMHDIRDYVDEYMRSRFVTNLVCGCLKFIPAEEPCKK